MRDVNGWLLALSFLGGLILTAALMMRRVTREVPVTHTVSARAGAGVDAPEHGLKAPDLGKVAAGAGAALSGAAEKVGEFVESVGDKIEGLFERDTHGSGSARLTPRKVAPAGYTVKFDPDTKRYYLPGSAEYDALETEWWFIDEDSAKAAGFSRWDDFKEKVGDLVGQAGDLVGQAGDKVGAAAGAVGAKVSAAAGAVGDKIEGLFERDTHGSGSARLTPRKVAPAGYTVKFDPDTKRYYLPGSAEYDALETEWWFIDEDSAKAAGFSRWEAAGAVGFFGAAVAESVDVIPPGPHGKGSAVAGADGSGPVGWLIKGNADSMLYHPPDSPYYSQTIAELWFFDEETAKKAGFDKWDKNIKKS